jgi:anaerobic selenocysteine-containing dehydrogenase
MSQTGASADEWVPAKPGTEGVLALGLARVILNGRLRPETAGAAAALIQGWSDGLPQYTPEAVQARTGVPAAKIERLGHELAEFSPAVAIIGGAPLAQTNGLFQALAVNALNALLGSVGEPGGLHFMPQVPLLDKDAPRAPRGRSLQAAAAEINAAGTSPVQVLFLDDGNPAFSTPSAWHVRDALDKVPFIVGFGNFIDETSRLADLILPDHSFLESWIDELPESGALEAVVSLAPPAMRPLHDTRATSDVLLDIGRQLRTPITFPWQTHEDMARAALAGVPAAPSVDTWSDAQKQGGWWGTVPPASARDTDRPSPPVAAATEAEFDGAPAGYPFHFHPYASAGFLDGSLAHLPWLQELPDPITSAMWCSWIELNPRTAQSLGIAQGDIVEIASSQGAVRAPAVILPAIAPDVVAMPVGQGHEAFTRYATNRGANPIAILAPVTERVTGALAWAATRVKVSRIGGPDGSLILFAGELRERPHEETRSTGG